jgi:hypothetical protein
MGTTFTSPAPPYFQLLNANAGTAGAGSPVYRPSAGNFDLAKADSLVTSATIVGVLMADCAHAAVGNIQDTGALTLTTAQWDARTGASGGLTPGWYYYVDPANAGEYISATDYLAGPTLSSGQVYAPVGYALTTTTMLIRIRQSVLT